MEWGGRGECMGSGGWVRKVFRGDVKDKKRFLMGLGRKDGLCGGNSIGSV